MYVQLTWGSVFPRPSDWSFGLLNDFPYGMVMLMSGSFPIVKGRKWHLVCHCLVSLVLGSFTDSFQLLGMITWVSEPGKTDWGRGTRQITQLRYHLLWWPRPGSLQFHTLLHPVSLCSLMRVSVLPLSSGIWHAVNLLNDNSLQMLANFPSCIEPC